MTKSILLSTVAIALGLLLIGGSVIYPRMADPRAHWSEGQAETLTDLARQLKEIMHERENATSAAECARIDLEAEAAMKAYRQAEAELNAARTRSERPAVVLRWSGTLCLGLGLFVYYAARR